MAIDFEQKSDESQIENYESKVEILLKQNEELKGQVKQLEGLLTLDPLTEVYNRRYIEVELRNLFEEVSVIRKKQNQRTNKKDELSIVFLDIDDFKGINDKYGHKIGDIALKEVSKLVKESIRSSDKVARYGGEEFIVVLLKANKGDAYKKAEKIRIAISQRKIKINNEVINLTATLGIASLENEKSIEELLEKADQVLYQGKKTGKNKTVIAD